MTEIEFRLECLKKSINKFDKKRIVLYGIADNAKAILREFEEQNIIALLDSKHTGQYIYGKKIISLEETILLQTEVIIIAAEAASSWIVSERIREFCQSHSILLLNMYGVDEKEINYRVLLQDLEYWNLDENEVYRHIREHEIICFQLMDVLCASKYYKKEDFLNAFEKHCQIVQLAKNRLNAEKMIDPKQPKDLIDIYNNYWTISLLDKEKIEYLRKQEEQLFIQSIIPRDEMVCILNKALEQGKKVYIISELYYSEKATKQLLEKIGVQGYYGIVQPNIARKTISDGAMRIVLGEQFNKNGLYIGTKHGCNLMLAQSYHMDVCMVKAAWDMLWEMPDVDTFNFKVTEERKSALWEWVQMTLNSPFPKHNQLYRKPDSIDNLNEKKMSPPDLYPSPTYERIEELEILRFPIVENPLVSIIIPVYNNFEFTYNCLKSIFYNSCDIDYEVIVADDASTDDTIHLDSVVKGVRILHNQSNIFFIQNCNQAASHAKGRYLLFLNNDTQVQYNWLKPLVYLLEKRQDVGMAGSKLLYPDGSIQEAGGIIWKDGTAANYGRGDAPDLPEYNYVREVDYITGASIIIRKDLWEEIGGFDRRYMPAYCEDSDLALEVREHGKKVIYQPASVVVHFEGVSNGKNPEEGIRRYQSVNIEKLRKKWAAVLNRDQYLKNQDIFSARERKQKKKTILVFSQGMPRYDYDAGSKTIYSYIRLFLKKGYLVKFVPSNFFYAAPYTYEMQQMGVEILYGDYYKKNFNRWIIQNQGYIEYAFINYPDCGKKFIDLLKITSIKIRYYGHDLHYLRKQREYNLTGNLRSSEASEEFYEIERDTIAKADIVYYPSDFEVQIVKEKFKKDKVRQLQPYIYEFDSEECIYEPEKREGMVFIGGYNHPPNVDAILWFVKEIYPQVYKVRHIPFYIVGSNEPIEIQNLKNPGIIHMGYVTEAELKEIYRKVRLAVVPLRYGAGIKGKTVDAMFWGIPMVSTAIGIEGIPEAVQYVEVANDADTFAVKILKLYEDRDKLMNTSVKFRNIIRKYYSQQAAWEKIEKDFI